MRFYLGPAWRVLTGQITEGDALLEIGQRRLATLADNLTQQTGQTLLSIEESVRAQLGEIRQLHIGLYDEVGNVSQALSGLSERVTALELRQAEATAVRERSIRDAAERTMAAELRAIADRIAPPPAVRLDQVPADVADEYRRSE